MKHALDTTPIENGYHHRCTVCEAEKRTRKENWNAECKGSALKEKFGVSYVGPGTILKRKLSSVGIEETESCSCPEHASAMDLKGPMWCRDNIQIILKWMKQEAKHRWRFAPPDFVVEPFILSAIQESEESLNV